MAQDKRLLVQVYKDKGPTRMGVMALFYSDGTLVQNQTVTDISGGLDELTKITVEFVIDNKEILLCSMDEFEKITGKKCGSP